MSKDFIAHIDQDSPRASDWRAILGSNQVYIKSPIPFRANLPGHPDTLVYEVDIPLLTPEQRAHLVEHLATKFNIPADQVEEDLDNTGCPIRADHVTIEVHNPQRWF